MSPTFATIGPYGALSLAPEAMSTSRAVRWMELNDPALLQIFRRAMTGTNTAEEKALIAAWVTERVTRTETRTPLPESDEPIPKLSAQQIRVLGYLSAGLDAAEIAELMHLSVDTVKTYRERIRTKLGAVNTTQAVARWLRGMGV